MVDKIKAIVNSNEYIVDKTDWPYRSIYSNYVHYFHPCNNGNFVFYDGAAHAIRVIRER